MMAADTVATVVPPDGSGWVAQGPYGLQRFKEGPDGRLLRLDEALHWMGHKLEWPRQKAVYAVFSHLVQMDEADPPRRRMVLYVINRDDYAQPLAIGDRLNPKTEDLWSKLSFSYPDASSWGTVREIADLWEESWPGFAQHTDEFYRAGWGDYCKRVKKAAVLAKGAIDGEEEYRTRHHLSLEEWKQRCAKAVLLLSRVAVPFAVAHELWSWGTVVNEAPASPFPLADWPALMAYRKANSGSDWGVGNQIAVGKTELGQRTAGGKRTESDALEVMAKELGLKGREALRKVLKKPESDRMRAKKAAPAPVATVVRDGKAVNRKTG